LKVIVLGGAGLIGRAVVRDLAEQADVELTIADANPAAAEEIARWAGGDRIAVRELDVTDERALVDVLSGAGCAVNAVNYYHNLTVMGGCLRAGVPYVDLGGLFHMTRKQMELDGDFREAGVTAVLGMGAAPGVTNLQAALAARGLESVESIRIFDGAVPIEEEGINWGYSLATILDEVTMNPVTFREGKFQELEPIAEPELYAFSPPVGPQTVHHSLHSEIATLPLTFADRGVREVSYKINYFGLAPDVFARLKLLVDLGLASKEPLTVGGASVRPRDVLIAALSRQVAPAAQPFEDTSEELVTEVRGRAPDGPVKVTVRTICPGKPDWGLSGDALVTGVPSAIAAVSIASGRLRAPGVNAPESVVEPEAFFGEMAARGAQTKMSVERTVAG
jgi:saccharopine dehydrogenase (NAD+, L-lysine-forming)